MTTAAEKRWYAAVASLENCVLCNSFGVQVAHWNETRGMGQKSAYYFTAALCPTCHHDVDNGNILSKLERRWLLAKAIVLTLGKLISSGRLRLV